MVLKKFEREHYDTFITMCADFFSTGATVNTVPLEYFHNTFNQILKNSELLDGFVIEVDCEIVGYTHISFSWNNDFGGKVLWLEEIYIKPNHRKKGYARQAIDLILDKYSNDVKSVRLEVTEQNKAAELYKEMGFVPRNYNQYYKEV